MSDLPWVVEFSRQGVAWTPAATFAIREAAEDYCRACARDDKYFKWRFRHPRASDGWRERGPGRQLQDRAIKNKGGSWFGDYAAMKEGVKQRGTGREQFAGDGKISRLTSSKSPARKFASAMIAKIPLPLSQHIAATFKPRARAA